MIREIEKQDSDQIQKLIYQLDRKTKEIQLNTLAKNIEKINSLRYMKIIGFEKDKKIIGMCTIGKIEGITYNCRPFAVIENVVVDESYRSKGIGKALIKRAIQIAENWKCYKIILETGTRNEWKLQFYEQCGLERGEKTAFIKRFEDKKSRAAAGKRRR